MLDWNDYLIIAEQMASIATDGARRCAISRAYYAVYNVARSHLNTLGIETPKNPDHYWIWEEFFLLGDAGQKVAQQGKILRSLRVRADYHDVFKKERRDEDLERASKGVVGKARHLIYTISNVKLPISDRR